MSENQNQSFSGPYQQAHPYYYQPQASPAYYPMYTRQQPVSPTQTGFNVQGMLPPQQSYIENILRLNKGKHVTVYMSFDESSEWNSRIFKGIIEAAGRDHIILSDPETNKRYLLLMVYLDYVTFDEEINYSYPYGSSPDLANQSPR
ncbi:spore coat protein GerQ [Virgibacillus sp. W0181]|uniref:spore coat protein GerQ n=1 Tax=Virgibacillus sp. W0181 TaxID=3391581 RepID=UPI003F48785B